LLSLHISAQLMADLTTLDDGTEVCLPVPDTWSDSDAESDADACQSAGNSSASAKALEILAAAPGHDHSKRSLAEQTGTSAAALAALASLQPAPGTAADIAPSSMSAEAFAECFAGGVGKPAVLHDVPKTEGWRATERWQSQESFLRHYGHLPVQVTEMGSLHGLGKPLRVELTLTDYASYARENQVDWPFYVWERNFNGERRHLLDDFSSPKILADDLYDMSPEVREFLPLSCHLFVLVGGRRTGSNMHRDPKWSSAWNTLLVGRKRWVMFPRDVHASEIGALEGDAYKDGGPQAYWWLDHYPRLRERGQHLGMVDMLQNSGDTVFIPAGWWHATLNLPSDGEDITVACTRNVFPPATLPYVLPHMRVSDPAFAKTFVTLVRQMRSEALRFLPDDDEARATAGPAKPAIVGDSESWQIHRRGFETLSLAECRQDFIRKGRPLIIEGLGPFLVSKESCNLSRDWLSTHFGEKMVAVYRNFCNPQERAASDKEDRADLMRLREALVHLQKGGSERDGLYLYDLSLPLQLPGLLDHVQLPRFFTHCYLQQTMRQHCFSRSWPTLFIGAKGSQAKLHVDQWHGHFWMHLVSGRKRWTIWHPEDAHLLHPVVLPGRLHPVFPDLADLEDGKVDAPEFRKARRIDIDLDEGETLFVPGGAPHLVVNLTDSVAFAGNFLDESNFEDAMNDIRAMAALEESKRQSASKAYGEQCGANSAGPMAGLVAAIEEIDFDPDKALHKDLLPGRMLAVRYRDFAGGAAAGWGPVPPDEDQFDS